MTPLGRYALVAAALASASPAAGQAARLSTPGPEVHLLDGTVLQPGVLIGCHLPASHPEMRRAERDAFPTPRSFDPDAPVTAVFEVTYSGFSTQAQAAFQRAVDIWSQHLASPVPIRVQAEWAPLGPGVLASAGTNGRFRNVPGEPFASTWYSSALADAISGTDRWTTPPNNQPDAPDIVSNFSSSINWYYGLDGNTPQSQYDLVTVVLHELGHGLGFQGSATVSGDIGRHSQGGLPYALDRFVEDRDGVAMLDGATYPNNSVALGAFLRSNQVYFDGPYATATLGTGTPPRLYAPAAWNGGSSYSHYNESDFGPNDPNALLTPFVSNGESHGSPGPIVCALFKDTGWPLSPLCEAMIITPPVAEEGGPILSPAAALAYAGPNPFGTATGFRLEVGRSQTVRAELLDVVGRRVATLFDGAVAAGVPVELGVDGARLAPGVYVVRVAGETFVESRPVTLAR